MVDKFGKFPTKPSCILYGKLNDNVGGKGFGFAVYVAGKGGISVIIALFVGAEI